MDNIEFITSSLQTGVAHITPELAKHLLATTNHDNRPLKPAHVKMPVTAINDEWMLNGETIAFSKSGRLLDGQHRLTACVNTGKAFQTVIIKGIEDEAAFGTIDTGKPRSVESARLTQSPAIFSDSQTAQSVAGNRRRPAQPIHPHHPPIHRTQCRPAWQQTQRGDIPRL